MAPEIEIVFYTYVKSNKIRLISSNNRTHYTTARG
jgi:hypothetical protein